MSRDRQNNDCPINGLSHGIRTSWVVEQLTETLIPCMIEQVAQQESRPPRSFLGRLYLTSGTGWKQRLLLSGSKEPLLFGCHDYQVASFRPISSLGVAKAGYIYICIYNIYGFISNSFMPRLLHCGDASERRPVLATTLIVKSQF